MLVGSQVTYRFTLLFLFMCGVWGSFLSFPMKKVSYVFVTRYPCLSSEMVNVEVGTRLTILQRYDKLNCFVRSAFQ